ncbi:hypothetical protein D3C80_1873910 [compost metagenome]
MRSGLVKQFLLSAGCCFALRLLLLGHALALSLNGGLLRQSNAVLLGALFCFAAQAGKFCLLGVVLLPGSQRCLHGVHRRLFGPGGLSLEFLPSFAQLEC